MHSDAALSPLAEPAPLERGDIGWSCHLLKVLGCLSLKQGLKIAWDMAHHVSPAALDRLLGGSYGVGFGGWTFFNSQREKLWMDLRGADLNSKTMGTTGLCGGLGGSLVPPSVEQGRETFLASREKPLGWPRGESTRSLTDTVWPHRPRPPSCRSYCPGLKTSTWEALVRHRRLVLCPTVILGQR